MISETKYRKRALELWEQSREETKRELAQELAQHSGKLASVCMHLKSAIGHWFSYKKKHLGS
ncbi:hypothetical protein [Paenibacillus humicola]|uniref:hypothetical protein n=1 Tax=Paenibacillus humicola TaxID=3110540 RepID=UPI00237B375A|nr:hypothetical protein [Paenibacillus humicola]